LKKKRQNATREPLHDEKRDMFEGALRQPSTISERPMGGGQYANRNNPFGDHAETIDATNATGPLVIEMVGPQGKVIAASTASIAANAAVNTTRGASKRDDGLKAMDFTTSGPLLPATSPVVTEFSMSSDGAPTLTPTGTGAAIAAAGGPANTTVHRVQLGFQPSMADELEIKAGQLIRLLQEYDDGWVCSLRIYIRPI
jgi:hypothetical protein